MPESEVAGESIAYEVVITAVYAVAIGVNIYIIVDQVSDGALSRSVSMRWRNWYGKVRGQLVSRSQFRRQAAHVVFEAMSIVDEEGNEQ